jgi:hypothetical protein
MWATNGGECVCKAADMARAIKATQKRRLHSTSILWRTYIQALGGSTTARVVGKVKYERVAVAHPCHTKMKLRGRLCN